MVTQEPPRPPRNPDELRLYAVVPAEVAQALRQEPGKLAAQAGHAFLECWFVATLDFTDAARAYRYTQSQAKIVLLGPPLAELLELAKPLHSVCARCTITDEGRTVFGGPTVTMVGLGPVSWNQLTPELRLLRPFR